MSIFYPDNTSSRTVLPASGISSDSNLLLNVSYSGERSLSLAELKKTGVNVVNVKQYGAVGDGVADDTVAVNLAISGCPASGRVYFPAGTYIVSDIKLYARSIFGESANATIIKAKAGATYVFRCDYDTVSGSYWWDTKIISDISIDGNSKLSHGVMFDADSTPYLAGMWRFDNVTFKNCDKAIYKPYGNIGNVFDKIQIRNCNYGMYAVASSAPMHAGNDTWRDGEINSCSLAAIYYNGLAESGTTTGGISFENTIIEGNPGFGIFTKGVRGEAAPLTLSRVYLELNGTSGSVTIDGSGYTPLDFYLEKTYAKLDNCGINSMRLINTHAVADFCKLPERAGYVVPALLYIDNDSSLIVNNARYSYRIGSEATVCSVANMIYRSGYDANPAGSYAPSFKTLHRNFITTAIPPGGTLLDTQHFDAAAAYNLSSRSTVPVNDGILKKTCAEVMIAPTGSVECYTNSVFRYAVGPSSVNDWFVITGAVKPIDVPASGIRVVLTGFATQLDYLQLHLTQGEWTTVGTICHGIDTTNNGASPANGSALYVYNNTSSSGTVRLADWQAVRFSGFGDAVEFFNSRQFVTDQGPVITYAASIPTVGTWYQGSIVYNTAPSGGGYIGWSCTASGVPGTWKTFGAISP